MAVSQYKQILFFSLASADGVAARLGSTSLESSGEAPTHLDRQVSGAESPDSHASSGSGALKREVYGCEQAEDEAEECSSQGVQTKGTEQVEVKDLKTDDTSLVRTEAPENGDASSVGQSSDVQESVESSEEAVSPNQPGTTEFQKQLQNVSSEEKSSVGVVHKDEVVEESDALESEISAIAEHTQECKSSDSELTPKGTVDMVVTETEDKQTSQTDNNSANQSESQEVSESSEGDSLENGEWI